MREHGAMPFTSFEGFFLTQGAVFGILLGGVDVSMLRISRTRLKGLVRSSEKVSSILYV
jgi:hypothetical protein